MMKEGKWVKELYNELERDNANLTNIRLSLPTDGIRKCLTKTELEDLILDEALTKTTKIRPSVAIQIAKTLKEAIETRPSKKQKIIEHRIYSENLDDHCVGGTKWCPTCERTETPVFSNDPLNN